MLPRSSQEPLADTKIGRGASDTDHEPASSHPSAQLRHTESARIAAEFGRRAREIPADYYSLDKPANLLMHVQTLRSAIAVLRRGGYFPMKGRRVADIGCGSGSWLLEFAQWGADPADLAGIDLIPARVERARRLIPEADLRLGNASSLPWDDRSFDIISQFVVFTSILDPELKHAAAREMLRVLKPGGAVLWFDFRIDNPRNKEVKGIGEREIHALFPGCTIGLEPALLAPPLARLIAPRSWLGAQVLHALPWLRTHYAGLIRKAVQ